MCRQPRLRQQSGFIIFILFSASALQLPQCVDRGWMQLKESEMFTITCQGFVTGDTVKWSLVLLSGVKQPIGVCRSGEVQCQTENSGFVVTRPSPTFSAVRVIQNVGSLDGQTISCSGDDDSNTQFCNIKVVYDKSNVFVSVTGPDVIITTGTASVTLKCTVTGLVTDVRFMWSNVKCDVQASYGSTCIFTPIPPQDDGKVVTCTANVSKSDGSGREEASASYAVSLRYPPFTPPVISSNVPDVDFRSREIVTLTCRVKGGKPPVSVLRFACGGNAASRSDVTADGTVASSLTIVPADLVDACICSAVWSPEPQLYTATATWSITQREIPAKITMFSSNGYTNDVSINERDKTTVTFRCQADGYPDPSLTLKGPDNNTLTTTQSRRELGYFITSAICEHTGVYTCAAENGIGARDEVRKHLTVNCAPRYSPRDKSSSSPQILETELSLEIIAIPPPTNFTFTYQGIDMTNEASIIVDDIVNISCKEDSEREYVSTCIIRPKTRLENGVYRVNISNPFGGLEYVFKVLFQAPAKVTLLSFNGANNSLTVSEEDQQSINITCEAMGYPKPTLVLRQPGGAAMTSVMSAYRLLHTLAFARCENMGLYTCVADNGVDTADQVERFLNINCGPRRIGTDDLGEIPRLNGTTMQVELIANPVPSVSSYIYRDETGSKDGILATGLFETTCERDLNLTYIVLCLIKRLQPLDDGLYDVIFTNPYGSLVFALQLENAESAAVASFTLNNIASEVLVVNESEAVSVELECKVSGKPLPTIKLTQPDGAVLASSVSAGEVKFSLPPAVCEMMGPYTCAADNGVGTPDKMLRHLIVNCAPRPFSFSTPQSVLETLSPGGLYIRLIAHPVPDRFTYTYHSDAIPREDKEIPAGVFTTSCEQDRLLENVVTCHLSTNQTLEEGEYKLAVGNQMGSSDYLFWVSAEKSVSGSTQGSNLSTGEFAGIIVGVMVAISIIIIAVAIAVHRQNKGNHSLH